MTSQSDGHRLTERRWDVIGRVMTGANPFLAGFGRRENRVACHDLCWLLLQTDRLLEQSFMVNWSEATFTWRSPGFLAQSASLREETVAGWE